MPDLAPYQRELAFGAVWLALLAWFILLCPRPRPFRSVIEEWAHRDGLTIETLRINRFSDRMRHGVSTVQECARVSAVDRRGRSQEFLLIYGHPVFGTFRATLDVRIFERPARGPRG